LGLHAVSLIINRSRWFGYVVYTRMVLLGSNTIWWWTTEKGCPKRGLGGTVL